MKVWDMAAARPLSRPQKGVSIEVQRRAVERVAESNGWDLTWLADEGVSGRVPPESPKRFRAVLALLEAGEADALIFTKVDRASRCTEDFARLLRMSEEQGWRLIVTEMGIDTRTPIGKAMAHMAVVFAELERDFIRSRTREALAVRRDHVCRPRPTELDARRRGGPRCAGAHGGQDRVRHCPPFEQGRCADGAGCARLVASHGPRAADAGKAFAGNLVRRSRGDRDPSPEAADRQSDAGR
jgi:hypothetical protein